MNTTPSKCCRECHGPLTTGGRRHAIFCSITCKAGWNNRRKVRGAMLYDLFMATRYDRAAAKDQKVWSAMCRLAEGWNEEDGKRQTFERPKAVIQRLQDNGSLRRGERFYDGTGKKRVS